jgi:hypothetical protein
MMDSSSVWKVSLSEQAQAQFPVAQLLRTILLDQVFASMVVEVAPK